MLHCAAGGAAGYGTENLVSVLEENIKRSAFLRRQAEVLRDEAQSVRDTSRQVRQMLVRPGAGE